MENATAKAGDWVEVQIVVLDAGHRSGAVPADTSNVPYLARVKGFLVDHAAVDHRGLNRGRIHRELPVRESGEQRPGPARTH